MTSLYIPLLLLLLLFTQRATPEDASYDYLVLAFTWAPGFCTSLGSECATSKVSNSWTIHGLWPSRNQQTSKPAFCEGDPFDTNNLSAKLLNQLSVAWPTYKQSNSDQSFWSYEWSKHGTCAVQGDSDTFPSQSSYFSRTLELYNLYNFSSILEDNSIFPGSTTSLSELKTTFSRHFGLYNTVTFQCSTYSNKRHVTGSHFCLSSNLTVISCPSGKTDSCSLYNPIEYTSSGYQVLGCSLLLFVCILLF